MTKEQKSEIFELGDFELRHSTWPQKPPILNQYVIEVLCILEEGDYSQRDTLSLSMPANTAEDRLNLLEKLLEIEIVKNQFPNGRGAMGPGYNQRNYFCPDLYEAVIPALENTIKYERPDKHWLWFEDIPYSYDSETTYDIDRYNVSYYNSIGVKTVVELKLPARFLKDLQDFNVSQGLHQYNMEAEDWEQENFIEYRQKIVAVLEKEMLNLKVALSVPQVVQSAPEQSTEFDPFEVNPWATKKRKKI